MRFMLTENVPSVKTAEQKKVTRIANRLHSRVREAMLPVPNIPKVRAKQ